MKIKKFLPFIGIVIFFYIIYRIGLTSITAALLEVKLGYLVAATLALFVTFLLQAIRWNAIMKAQGINVGFFYALQVNLISQYYGVITPGRLGGLMKAAYLKKKVKNLATAASSVIIDRVLDMVAIAFMALAGVLLLADKFLIDFNKSLFFLVIVVVICIAFLNKKLARYFLKKVHTFLVPEKYKIQLRANFHDFYGNFPKMHKLIFPAIISFILWIYIYFITYLFALAFSITEVPLAAFLLISAIGTIITLIPITVSGLGTREAFFLLAFGAYGVAPERIVLMSVTGVLALTLVSALSGLVTIHRGRVTL